MFGYFILDIGFYAAMINYKFFFDLNLPIKEVTGRILL